MTVHGNDHGKNETQEQETATAVSGGGRRIVIYPMYAADEAQTEKLLDALCDVLIAFHGVSPSEDESLRSIVTFEETDENIGTEGWLTELALSRRVIRFYVPGAAIDEETAALPEAAADSKGVPS